MLDLQPIKARLAAATPGPWEPAELQGQSRRNSFFSVAVVGRREVRAGIPCQAQPDECDADLIANAPTDLAALVAEVERLRKEDEENVNKIAELERRIDDLVEENISLRNQGTIKVAAPPQTLVRLQGELEKMRSAIRQFAKDTDGALHPREFGAAYAKLLGMLND